MSDVHICLMQDMHEQFLSVFPDSVHECAPQGADSNMLIVSGKHEGLL